MPNLFKTKANTICKVESREKGEMDSPSKPNSPLHRLSGVTTRKVTNSNGDLSVKERARRLEEIEMRARIPPRFGGSSACSIWRW